MREASTAQVYSILLFRDPLFYLRGEALVTTSSRQVLAVFPTPKITVRYP